MGTGRFLAVTLLTALAAGASAFLIGAGTAHARSTTGGGVIAEAFGNQQISSSPGVYAQTTSEYSTSWSWSQLSASYDYYWYIFQSNGTLTASGHRPSGGGDSRTVAGNVYYFKEYNNEPAGSGHINVLSVDYCC